MNEIILGLLRHGLTAAGGSLVTKGLIGADDLAQGVGAVMTLVGIVWSVMHKRGVEARVEHAATTGERNGPPASGAGALMILGSLLLAGGLGAGCAGLAPGADALVVRTEQAQTIARGTFDLVLQVDHSRRDFFRAQAPEFHGFCEWLRAPQLMVGTNQLSRAATMLWNLDQVKVGYKANRGSSNAVIAALGTVEAALGQAQGWIGRLNTITNQ